MKVIEDKADANAAATGFLSGTDKAPPLEADILALFDTADSNAPAQTTIQQVLDVSKDRTETLTNKTITAPTITDPAIIGAALQQLDDNGALAGPLYELFRNSTTPVVADVLGQHDFSGQNASAIKAVYARIFAEIVDTSNGAEHGVLRLASAIAGAVATRVSVGHGVYTGIPSGDMGANTVNGLLYDNGTRVSESILDSGSATSVAELVVDLSTFIANGFNGFTIMLEASPSTDGAGLFVHGSIDGGATRLVSGISSVGKFVSGNGDNTNDDPDVGFVPMTRPSTNGVGSGANEYYNGKVEIDIQANATGIITSGYYSNVLDSNSDTWTTLVNGFYRNANLSGVVFAFDTGNIQNISWKLRGHR